MTPFWKRLALPLVLVTLSVCDAARGQTISPHTAVIVGRVIYEDGTPAANLPVLAEMQTGAELGFTISVSSKMPVTDRKGRKSIAYVYEGPPPTQGFDHLGSVTQADGTYRITGLATAPYNVLNAPSWFANTKPAPLIATAAEGVAAQEGKTVTAPDIVLTRGAIIQGQVVDSKTGRPLAGITIISHGPARPLSGGMALNALTDKDGHFSMRVAPGVNFVGTYQESMKIDEATWFVGSRYQASVDGRAWKQEARYSNLSRVDAKIGETHTLTIRLERGKLQKRLTPTSSWRL